MRQVIATMALCLYCSIAYQAEPATVGGKTYELTDTTWFWIDSSGEEWEIVPPWIEIQFDQGVSESQRDTFATNHELTESPVIVPDGYYRYSYDPETNPIDLLEDCLSSPIVSTAELDYLTQPQGDQYFTTTEQWNAYLVNLDKALALTRGDSTVLVAILDTGVDSTHEDLQATVWHNPNETVDEEDNDGDTWYNDDGIPDDIWGWSFTPGYVGQPWPPASSHGTAVAGMAMAVNDNTVGLASAGGGAPGARPIKWLAVGGATGFSLRDAFRYCKYKGQKTGSPVIINYSSKFSSGDTRAIGGMEEFLDAGGILVASTGNFADSLSGIAFPARHDSVIAVGAVDQDLNHWYYSQYSTASNDLLVAPAGDREGGTGEQHYSTDNQNGIYTGYNPGSCNCSEEVTNYKYTLFGGTSAAAPQVAAVAALLWSYNPNLSPFEIRERLNGSARDLGEAGPDTLYGHGLLDAYRAITLWGPVASDTTWGESGGPTTLFVSGDITVPSGKILTINRGTTIKIAADNEKSGSDTSRVAIVVNGTLKVASGTGQVVFESLEDTPADDDWVGIQFTSTSTNNVLDDLVIKHAQVGIGDAKGVTVTDLTIDSCEVGIAASAAGTYGGCVIQNIDHGIVMSANATAENCTIQVCSTGVQVSGSVTSAVIDRGLIKDIVSAGVQIDDGCGVTISETTIQNSDDLGIEVHNDTEGEGVTIEDCSIDAVETGIDTGALTTVKRTTITVCRIGVNAHTDSAFIDSTVVDNAGYAGPLGSFAGVNVINGGRARIAHCTLKNSEKWGARAAKGGTAYVEETSLRYNQAGFFTKPAGTQPVAVIDNCTIKHNTYGVQIDETTDVTVVNSLIDSNTTAGVFCENDGHAELRLNTISNSPVGILADGSDPEIRRGNQILANTTGIQCDNYADAVAESTIVGLNTKGVVSLNGSNPDLGHVSGGSSVGYNDIAQNTTYHVENLVGAVNMSAENVSWHGEAPDSSKFVFGGGIDFVPYLGYIPNLLPSYVFVLPSPEATPPDEAFPAQFGLAEGYPNPFNPVATIAYQVPSPGSRVRIDVYNVKGQRVATLVNDHKPAGYYRIVWDGESRSGAVASGVYFVRMETAAGFSQTRKLVLLK